MIKIVNKHWNTPTDHDIYCGRGSLVGNPYSHLENTKAQFKVATREEAVEKYLGWFTRERLNNPTMYAFLSRMKAANEKGVDMNLVCYCAPADCHCRLIKEYLEAGA